MPLANTADCTGRNQAGGIGNMTGSTFLQLRRNHLLILAVSVNALSLAAGAMLRYAFPRRSMGARKTNKGFPFVFYAMK